MSIPSLGQNRTDATGERGARVGLARFVSAVVATAVVALAVVILPLVALRPHSAKRDSASGVTIAALSWRFVPDAPAATKQAVIREISSFLRDLYESAFTNRVASADRGATPAPVAPLQRFFSGRAASALVADPGVFTPGGDVAVAAGRVAVDGVVTMTDRQPAEAFLDIVFRGNGASRGTPVTVTQTGTLLLGHARQGWIATGFDMRLEASTPTPTPSARRP